MFFDKKYHAQHYYIFYVLWFCWFFIFGLLPQATVSAIKEYNANVKFYYQVELETVNTEIENKRRLKILHNWYPSNLLRVSTSELYVCDYKHQVMVVTDMDRNYICIENVWILILEKRK